MADKKISALTAATLPLAGTEVLPIVQGGVTVKVATDDLTVKNLRSNATSGLLQMAGPAAGTTRVMTVPNSNFTAARTDTGQVFTGTQKFSGDAQAEFTDATVWASGTLGTNHIRATNLSATTNSYAGYGYQVTHGDTSTGFVVTAAIASGSFSADWVVQNRNAGNFQENLRVKAAGDVSVVKGNLVVGTAGKGIDFSANGGDVLSQYDEGTFTPTVQGTSTAGVGTYTIQTGHYVRIGKLVTFQISLAWSAHTGTGNIAGVYGLPFAAANVANLYSTHSILVDTLPITAGSVIGTYLGQAQSAISLRQTAAGGGATSQIPLPSSIGFLFIAGSYQVD